MTAFKESKADELNLDVQGGVFKLQQFTTIERDAIDPSKLVSGFMIYNITSENIQYWNATAGAWRSVTAV